MKMMLMFKAGRGAGFLIDSQTRFDIIQLLFFNFLFNLCPRKLIFLSLKPVFICR
jgi:hypothetical protein